MDKPLIRPIGYSDESPCSLLLRASENNGWKSPNAFISAYGIYSSKKTYSFLPLITQKKDWEKVCKVLGITNKVSCYERMPISRGSTYKYKNLYVPYRSLKLKEPSLCPVCANEKKYLLEIWDHKLITTCTTHNIKLLDTCPSCNEKLKWSRTGLLICTCGHKLNKSKPSTTNTKITQYIESVIINKDAPTLDLIFHLFECFEQFFKNLNFKVNQHLLAEIAGKALIKKSEVIASLVRYVKKAAKSYGLHPRLALMPFLKSPRQEANELATLTLDKLSKSNVIIKSKLNTIDFIINKISAEKVLGISSFLNRKLINNSILKVQSKNNLKQVSISSVNEILKLFTNTSKPKDSYKTIASQAVNSTTLIEIIKGVKSKKIKLSGMQISSGILSAKIPSKTKKYKFLKLSDVAEICGVNKENIRFAMWAGLIKPIDTNKTLGTTKFFDKKDALDFNEKYIFPGKIARDYNCNPTTVSIKLKASGCLPISGPGIDKGLTFLFKRSDIASLDLNKILTMTNYKTNVGRKKKSLNTNSITKEKGIPLRVVANQLGISIQKSSSLIKKGYLKELINTSRDKIITKKSFDLIKNIQQDTSLISLHVASKAVMESDKMFIRHWVNSQYVKLIDNGIDRYISKVDFIIVKNFKKKFVTSKEAGILTNTHRTHMLNLEKQNLIKPAKQLLCGKQVVNFYDRKQVIETCN